MKKQHTAVCFLALLFVPLAHAVAAPPSPFAPQSLAAGAAAATERAANYEEALARAKASGKDIVVLQRGSDWNVCGEMLYRRVWCRDEFVKALGDGFVLVTVDNPEVLGAPPLAIDDAGYHRDGSVAESPELRLQNRVGESAAQAACEIVVVASEGKVPFTRRADGAFLAGPTPNPPQDTLTLTMKPTQGGKILRLDFPPDDSLPNGGPGRAGNAVLSEVEVAVGKAPVVCQCAWGSVNSGNNFGPWTAVDGISSKTDEGWNLNGGQHVARTLLVVLHDAVPAGAATSVRLLFKSQWAQHVAGCLRAAIVDDRTMEADVRAVAAAQQLRYRNRLFTWFDGGHCPRIAFMDAQGRAVAADNRPRLDLTPQSLAALVHDMRGKRERRDALWVQAEKVQGPQRAELLRQGLDVLNMGQDEAFGRSNGWVGPNGNDKHYAFVQDAMRQVDPQDRSGAVRWLGFGLGAWGGVAWAPENQWWKKLEGKPEPTDADYAEALDCIDRELHDPRNRLLRSEHVQHIMQARYDLYLRKLKGKHDEEVLFQIQREIAAVDPSTFWGIGATGYLGMYHRTANPFLVYGWEGARQLKAGHNRWTLSDTAYFFDHAGSYRLTIASRDGADSFKVKRVALVEGTHTLAEARPPAGKDEVGPGRPVAVDLDCRAWLANHAYALQIEYEAREGHRQNNGSFSVEPLLADE